MYGFSSPIRLTPFLSKAEKSNAAALSLITYLGSLRSTIKRSRRKTQSTLIEPLQFRMDDERNPAIAVRHCFFVPLNVDRFQETSLI
jgi:hypothetical protein